MLLLPSSRRIEVQKHEGLRVGVTVLFARFHSSVRLSVSR